MPEAKCKQCEANQITSKVTMQVELPSSLSAAAAAAAAAARSSIIIIPTDSRLQVRKISRRASARSSFSSSRWSRAPHVLRAHARRQHAPLLSRRHCQHHWHFPARANLRLQGHARGGAGRCQRHVRARDAPRSSAAALALTRERPGSSRRPTWSRRRSRTIKWKLKAPRRWSWPRNRIATPFWHRALRRKFTGIWMSRRACCCRCGCAFGFEAFVFEAFCRSWRELRC